MTLLYRLKQFLKNPKAIKEEQNKFLKVFKEFIVFDLIITFAWSFLIGILLTVSQDFTIVFKTKITNDNAPFQAFLLTTLAAPILEEYAFRFGLKISRLTVSISLAVQIIIYIHLLGLIDFPFYFRSILMAITAIVVYFTCGKIMAGYLDKHFKYFVYFNILIFGLLHTTNYSYVEWYHFLYIPILTFDALLFSIYLSYVRLKNNFWYVLCFHMIHNAMIFGFGSLIK